MARPESEAGDSLSPNQSRLPRHMASAIAIPGLPTVQEQTTVRLYQHAIMRMPSHRAGAERLPAEQTLSLSLRILAQALLIKVDDPKGSKGRAETVRSGGGQGRPTPLE
ncbi:hypothetical protein J6590_080883 [Homalodisca vitripennis]|nr:hypothetical protein J6590_080883 [Homalodisca vitripennis]